MSCETGQCRKGARCLRCIERDGLTKEKPRRRPPRLSWGTLLRARGGDGGR